MPTAAPRPLWRRLASPLLKLGITAGAFYLLLTHPVRTGEGEVVALDAILDYLPRIDPRQFWQFALIAFGVRVCGIMASMLRWYVLLRGQGIVFPVTHVVTTFLIGRFLGTFLPSTIGLDGYKLYDAARFSGRTVEVTAATVIEKGMGIVGMFLCFLVTLPLGYAILGTAAAATAAITVPLSVLIIVAFFGLVLHPSWIGLLLGWLPIRRRGPVAGLFERVHGAAAAYRDQRSLLLAAGGLSFFVHFFTAVTYYFTAIAVGAVHPDFWEVAFASTIQIFATVMTPFTIAGEGVREIVQALLLAHRIGMEQSILSAALGFWAAEAPTLIGGLFYVLRGAEYRPALRLEERRVPGSTLDA